MLMKVKIGDNLTIEDVKQTGTEIKITKGKKVTASYEVEQNCTLNVYIKDEEDYGAMVRKTITGINNPEDTTKPTITGVQNNGIYANDVTPVVKDEHLKEVIVKKDQKQISYQNGAKLSEEGKYEITAIDEAGNKTVVSFIIDKTMAISSFIIDKISAKLRLCRPPPRRKILSVVSTPSNARYASCLPVSNSSSAS